MANMSKANMLLIKQAREQIVNLVTDCYKTRTELEELIGKKISPSRIGLMVREQLIYAHDSGKRDKNCNLIKCYSTIKEGCFDTKIVVEDSSYTVSAICEIFGYKFYTTPTHGVVHQLIDLHHNGSGLNCNRSYGICSSMG